MRAGAPLPLLFLLLAAAACGEADPVVEPPVSASRDESRLHLADALARARDRGGAGDAAGAAAAWEEVLALRPDHSTALYASAILLRRAGHPAKALERLAALRAVEPAGGRGYLLAAEILSDPASGDLRDTGRAVAMAEEALARNPEESGTHLGLGKALLLAGRTTEAADRLAVAARMNPRDGESRSLLGVLEARNGRKAEAAAWFRKVLAAGPARGVGALQGGVPGEGDTEASLALDRPATPGELRAAAGLHALGREVGGATRGEPLEAAEREALREALRARGTGEALLDADGDGIAGGAVVEFPGGFAAALVVPGGGVLLRR